MQDGGLAEGGGVAGSVFRHNDCEQGSGWCSPIPEAPDRFAPYVSSEISDLCVAFCVRVHEWWHFADNRRWSLKWDSDELVRFWELPAYQAEVRCLESFLPPGGRAPIELDPALLAPPRF